MSQVTQKRGDRSAGAGVFTLAVTLSLVWGCTKTVSPVEEPGGPGTTFVSGDRGGSSATACDGGQGGRPVIPSPADLMNVTGPMLGPVVTAQTPAPAISGGTLAMLSDGVTAVAADADRDQLYVVNVPAGTLTATLALSPGDQPGRLVEDGGGLVHVVLRGAGAIATLDPRTGQLTMRRTVCSTPRGIAYGAATNMLYLACASGQLMVFTPAGSTPSMTWTLDQDLRDVIVDGDGLLVTRFRSAEVLEVDAATGAITGRQHPPDFSNSNVHQGATFQAAVAWRAAAVPGGGMVMAHQRGMYDQIMPAPGGYAAAATDPCGTIVHSCVSQVKRGGRMAAGPAFAQFVLPIDIAVSPAGDKVAVVAAGNSQAISGTARALFVGGTSDVTAQWSAGCGIDDKHGPATSPTCFNTATGGTSPPTMGGTGGTGGSAGTGGVMGSVQSTAPAASGGTTGAQGSGGSGTGITGFCGPDPLGGEQPVSVAFADDQTVLVQTREPASLLILRGLNHNGLDKVVVPLSSDSRQDTGQLLFHANSGGGLACASCHPEGHDDGRVWSFECEGPRRTQDPSGGLLQTAPFHWNGDLPSFPALIQEVFQRRMSGPMLSAEQVTALQAWVDHLPQLPSLAAPGDGQVARGKALFESPAVGCASCHAGPSLTNNLTTDVGTGGGASFQVPGLRGVAWRAPYMHDGCAATLADRFTNPACGGGDRHGVTSQLSGADVADLIAYLQSL